MKKITILLCWCCLTIVDVHTCHAQDLEILKEKLTNVNNFATLSIVARVKPVDKQAPSSNLLYHLNIEATLEYFCSDGGTPPNITKDPYSQTANFSAHEVYSSEAFTNDIAKKKISDIYDWFKLKGASGPACFPKTTFDNLLDPHRTTYEELVAYKLYGMVQKVLKSVTLSMESLTDPEAGYIQINDQSFNVYINAVPTNTSKNKKNTRTEHPNILCKVDQINIVIKDNKVLVMGATIHDITNNKYFSITGTNSYPIGLSNDFCVLSFGWILLPYYPSIAGGGSTDNYYVNIRLCDLISYQPPKNTLMWGFNVESDGQSSMKPGDKLPISRKKLPDIINVTAFYHWYDALSTNQNSNSENEKSGKSSAQIELNINLPMNTSTYRACQTFNKGTFMFNFSPLGRATPFYYFDVTDPNPTLNTYELTRNYHIFSALNVTPLQINKLQRSWIHTFQFDIGLNHFTTKIRENATFDSNGTRLIDYDHFTSVTQVGPAFTFEYNNKGNDYFGFNAKLGTKSLNTMEGVNYSFRKFREKYNVDTKSYNEWIHILALELNMYVTPFGKEKNNNPSGFILRYRLWDDLNSSVDLHHEVMVGYALNINTLLK